MGKKKGGRGGFGMKASAAGGNRQGNTIVGKSVDPDKVVLLSGILNLAIQKHARFDELSGCLDLTSLADIEEVTDHRPDLNSELWCRVVSCEVKRRPTCNALYLAKNGIRSLHYVSQFLIDGIKLSFLSLEGNEIRNVEEIPRLAPLKLKHLVLVSNPLYEAVKQEKIIQKIKMLPSLQRIDSADINRKTFVDSLPIVRCPIEPPTNPVQNIVRDFMNGYYESSQKASEKNQGVDELLDFYDTKAVMSFTSFPHRLSLSVTGPGLLYAQKLTSNHHNVLNNAGLTHSLYTGKLNVGKGLEMLHSAEMRFDPESLKEAEVSALPDSLVHETGLPCNIVTVTMHGSVTFLFEDIRAKNKKSGDEGKLKFVKYFDRTWVLAAKGPKVLIQNDMIHIRDVKGETLPIYIPQANQRFYSVHMCRQDRQVAELCARTSLAPEHARKTLEMKDVQWDVQLGEKWVRDNQASGILGERFFDQRWAKPEEALFKIFQDLTQLQDTLVKYVLDSVNGDLWRSWLMFLAKDQQGALLPEHFLPPSA